MSTTIWAESKSFRSIQSVDVAGDRAVGDVRVRTGGNLGGTVGFYVRAKFAGKTNLRAIFTARPYASSRFHHNPFAVASQTRGSSRGGAGGV